MAVACPICRRPVPDPPAGGPRGDFPFCSPRCKLVDLGRWLSDAYQVPIDTDVDVADPDERD